MNNAQSLAIREGFFKTVHKYQPQIIILQETKFYQIGTLKIQGYQVFETVRSVKSGGGLLTAALFILEPVLITSDADNYVMTIQIINGYGPQEDKNQMTVMNFWN